MINTGCNNWISLITWMSTTVASNWQIFLFHRKFKVMLDTCLIYCTRSLIELYQCWVGFWPFINVIRKVVWWLGGTRVRDRMIRGRGFKFFVWHNILIINIYLSKKINVIGPYIFFLFTPTVIQGKWPLD